MKKEKSPLLRIAYFNRDHRSQLKRIVICIALGILSLLSVEAADKYVRKGATGTGTGADWTNAYTELNQVTTSGLPGFTVYVAAGTYTTNLPTFNNIDNWTLKRATTANHGTSTGWNNAYDGQVTHTGGKFIFLNGCENVIIDGGGTKEPWLFRVVGHNAANGKFQIEGGSNVTVRYIDMDGNGCPSDGDSEDGFRIGGTTNVILEHNWIHNYWYCSGGHSDGIQMPSVEGAILRYNKFQNCGMLLFFGDCAWGNQWANNVHLHHNIFIQEAGVAANYRILDMKGAGRTSSNHVIIENNTFYRESGFSGGTLYENSDCPANTSRRVIRNNIFYNGTFGLSSGWGSASNNCYYTGSTGPGTNNITSNPQLVDVANFDFRLRSGSPAIGAGISASLGYGDALTVDYDGKRIGSPPAIGAFEYGSGVPPATPSAVISVSPNTLSFGTVSVGANANLTVSVRNAGTGTLTGSATASAPFSVVSGGTYNLGAGQSQTVTVRYAPTSAGVHNSSVSFSGGGGASASVTGIAQGPLLGLTFDSINGAITSPFVANGSGYISQPAETGLPDAGRAVYVFNITTARDYTISANVNAPSESANSFYINIDAEPTDPATIWDIPVTIGFEDRTVSWRGNGSFDSPQYATKVFTLSAGTHQLIVRGRESGTQLRRITLTPVTSGPPSSPSPPSNLRVVIP